MSLAGARGGMLTVRLVLFTGAVLGTVQARCAIPPINEESAAQANYRCPPADTPPQRATTAVALASHTYSKNDLACAADFRVANADSAPEDLGGTITALESLASYAEYIRRLEAFDLGHIDALEIEARLDHSRQQAVTLLPRARTRWPEDARILTLTAMIDLSLAADDQEGDARLRARESFEKAIKLDPHALNGAPQRALARMYLDLPPLLGGDTAKALEYFTAAREEAPDDIRILNARPHPRGGSGAEQNRKIRSHERGGSAALRR
jgi:tetratricopeptide (TPR) repeat protein